MAALRWGLLVVTIVLGLLFLFSAVLNLGVSLPPLTFDAPSTSIAEFELVIGAVLLAAALVSNPYAYAGAYILAAVGITEGLLSSGVQGNARGLHETMVPFAVGGIILLALETRARRRARGRQAEGVVNRELVTALQFFVGGLVTLGGAAFARTGTWPVGTALGVVHLGVGLTGLLGGYALLKVKPWSRAFVIAVNAVTIVYSAFAETLAEVYAYLPRGINDALIGTIVAIVVSGVIILILVSKGPSRSPGGATN